MAKDFPEIRNVLYLSTAHITEETNMSLAQQATSELPAAAMPVVYPYSEYGYIVFQPSAWIMDVIPADLKAVLDYTAEMGCVMVVLDRDADTVSSLPTYDW